MSSGPHQAGDRVGGLADLRAGRVATLGDGLRDAVPQMVFQQAQRHRLQRLGHRRDLGQDVDAVLVVLDHLLQPADLALDPAQPLEVVLFVLGVSVHAASALTVSSRYYTPVGYKSVTTVSWTDHSGGAAALQWSA